MIGWFLWAWSNITFLAALAGLGALLWYLPGLIEAKVSERFLIVLAFVIGGFGWGELRYADGREDAQAGIIAKAEKAKREAESKLSELETEARETEKEIRLSNDPVLDNLRKQLREAQNKPDTSVSLQDELDLANDKIASLEAANQALADDQNILDCKPKTIIKYQSCLKSPVPTVAIDAWKAIK